MRRPCVPSVTAKMTRRPTDGGRAAQAVESDLYSQWNKYLQTCFRDIASADVVLLEVFGGGFAGKAASLKKYFSQSTLQDD